MVCYSSLLRVGDARRYPDVPSNTFDLSLSFGVFFYFDGDDDVTELEPARSADYLYRSVQDYANWHG